MSYRASARPFKNNEKNFCGRVRQLVVESQLDDSVNLSLVAIEDSVEMAVPPLATASDPVASGHVATAARRVSAARAAAQSSALSSTCALGCSASCLAASSPELAGSPGDVCGAQDQPSMFYWRWRSVLP